MADMKTKKRSVMAKRVARRWVSKFSSPEYRFQVLYGAKEIKNLPNLLRSFRDGKVALADVGTISDLGIKETFDALEVWSGDRKALMELSGWFEKRGFETTGVW